MARQRPSDRKPPAPAAKQQTNPRIIVLAVVLMAIAFGCGFGALTVQADIARPIAGANAPYQAFTVNQGDSIKTISVNLEQHKLIRSAQIMQLYLKAKGLNPSVEPGTYQLSPSMTISQMLTIFAKGIARPQVTFTILPGTRLSEYPAEIAASTIDATTKKPAKLTKFSADEFSTIAIKGDVSSIPNFSTNYWIVQPWDLTKGAYAALEGYLYPDTYTVYVDASTADIITTILDNFENNFCPIAFIHDKTQCMANQIKITPPKEVATGSYATPIGVFDALTAHKETLSEALIIASFAQREARSPQHYFLVASTYLNRLNYPNGETAGFLNADPAYQYYLGSKAGTGDPWAPLANLPSKSETNNPYNLYANQGLPPSAISNPAAYALYAAIDPPPTNYLYFYFGKDCNNHYFPTLVLFNNSQAQTPIAGSNDCK